MGLFKKKVPGGWLGKILQTIKWVQWAVKLLNWIITLLRSFPPLPNIDETNTENIEHEEVNTDS